MSYYVADNKHKYSYIDLDKRPSHEYNLRKLSEREAIVKRDCQIRLGNYKTTPLQRNLIWHHIFTTSNVQSATFGGSMKNKNKYKKQETDVEKFKRVIEKWEKAVDKLEERLRNANRKLSTK